MKKLTKQDVSLVCNLKKVLPIESKLTEYEFFLRESIKSVEQSKQGTFILMIFSASKTTLPRVLTFEQWKCLKEYIINVYPNCKIGSYDYICRGNRPRLTLHVGIK